MYLHYSVFYVHVPLLTNALSAYVQMFTLRFSIMVGHNKMLHPYRSHSFMEVSAKPLLSCLFSDLVVLVLVCSLHHHICILIWWICLFCWLVKSAPSNLHLIMAMEQPTLKFCSLFSHYACHLLSPPLLKE